MRDAEGAKKSDREWTQMNAKPGDCEISKGCHAIGLAEAIGVGSDDAPDALRHLL